MATLTLNPTFNGKVIKDNTNETWAVKEAVGGGVSVNNAPATGQQPFALYGGATLWNDFHMGFFTFNTSALTSSAVITSATFSLWGTAVGTNTFATAFKLNVFQGTPASSSTLATSDWNNSNHTALSTDVLVTSLPNGSYQDWALNSTGLSIISKTGNTLLCTMESNNFAPNIEPTKEQKACEWSCNWLATGSNMPKLVINYTIPGLTPPIANINQAVKRASFY